MEHWRGHKISGLKSALWLFTYFFDKVKKQFFWLSKKARRANAFKTVFFKISFGVNIKVLWTFPISLLANPKALVFFGEPSKNMERFKHSIFRNWSTDFSRMYLYFILRLFGSFFCKFRPMPLILVQQQAPSFIFRSRKFFIFNTHELYRKIRDLHITKSFINLSPVRIELTLQP